MAEAAERSVDWDDRTRWLLAQSPTHLPRADREELVRQIDDALLEDGCPSRDLRIQRNACAQISRLPVEILRFIFPLAVHNDQGSSLYVNLSHVCQLWRAIVLPLPILWRSIVVKHTTKSELIHTVLSRSGAAQHLTIRLELRDAYEDREVPSILLDILPIARHLDMQFAVTESRISQPLEFALKHPPMVSQLESVKLSINSDGGLKYAEALLAGGRTPLLREFTLQSARIDLTATLRFVGRIARNLTAFHLTAQPLLMGSCLPNPLPLLDALCRMKSLVTLGLHGPIVDPEPYISDLLKPVQFPHLKELYLSGSLVVQTRFLQHLLVPPGANVHVTCTGTNRGLTDHLATFGKVLTSTLRVANPDMIEPEYAGTVYQTFGSHSSLHDNVPMYHLHLWPYDYDDGLASSSRSTLPSGQLDLVIEDIFHHWSRPRLLLEVLPPIRALKVEKPYRTTASFLRNFVSTFGSYCSAMDALEFLEFIGWSPRALRHLLTPDPVLITYQDLDGQDGPAGDNVESSFPPYPKLRRITFRNLRLGEDDTAWMPGRVEGSLNEEDVGGLLDVLREFVQKRGPLETIEVVDCDKRTEQALSSLRPLIPSLLSPRSKQFIPTPRIDSFGI